MKEHRKDFKMLLVEDNPGDVRLTQEALKESKVNIQLDVVVDGEEAIEFLYKRGEYESAQRPDIILLDLNLPKKNGLEVLSEIKMKDELKTIPVIVLTTSDADHDIQNTYSAYANCFVIKPVDFDEFTEVIRLIEKFWFGLVRLPS